MRDYSNDECQRYWDPKRELGIQKDILTNPSKYDEYIGSFKLDGEWCRMIWDGKKVLLQSRSISKKTGKYTEKQDSLPHLVEEFKKLPKNTVILGEVCYDELFKRSKDVGSILRSLTPLALEKQREEKDKLHFYCFDVLCWEDVDLMEKGFEERISYLKKVKKVLGKSKYIKFAEIKSVDEIVNEYEDYLNKGGEGFVLQKKTATYKPGKRTAWESIKLKKCMEEIELPVVDIIEPEREYTGKELNNWVFFENNEPVTKYYFYGWKAGVVVDFNGTLCRVSSGVTDDDAKWLATKKAKELIKNKQLYAVVAGMLIEEDTGSIRHPVLIRIREDV